MSISSIIGNTTVTTELKRALAGGKISHSYLLIGQSRQRTALGLEFAKAILCPESPDDSCGRCRICRKIDHQNHEDLLWVRKSGNSIRKDAILEIIEMLSFKPFGSRTVVVIDDAHTMTLSAQNKLLKTLEEPPGPAVILLLAERKEALLETILSRCITYQLREEEEDTDEILLDIAVRWVELCAAGGPFYRRAELLEPFLKDRDRCLDFLDVTEDLLRERLMHGVGAEAVLTKKTNDLSDQRRLSPSTEGLRQTVAAVEESRKSLKLGYHIGYTMKSLCLCMDQRRITEESIWQK
ncbi:MAG: hypothetical protein WCY59_03690 [Anaerovoracaceae bacterium]